MDADWSTLKVEQAPANAGAYAELLMPLTKQLEVTSSVRYDEIGEVDNKLAGKKVDIVKIWVDDKPKQKRERYQGLSDEAFAQLVNPEILSNIRKNFSPTKEHPHCNGKAVQKKPWKFPCL